MKYQDQYSLKKFFEKKKKKKKKKKKTTPKQQKHFFFYRMSSATNFAVHFMLYCDYAASVFVLSRE